MRRGGFVTLVVGAILVGAGQAVAPAGGPPLYDGVVVTEPYRYLSPPPGAPGDPTSYTATVPVSGGVSPELIAATAESPPQAQLIAPQGAFTLGPTATALTVSITPVPPAVEPNDGSLAGNVYRFSITDQAGAAVSAHDIVTIVLRGPTGVTDASVARLVDDRWETVATEHAGQPGMFDANATLFGDFVLVASSGGPNPLIVGGAVVITIVVVVALGEVLVRNRRPTPPGSTPSTTPRSKPAPTTPRTTPSPSKRRRRGGRR